MYPHPPRPPRPLRPLRRRPLPHNPAPLIVGALLCAVAVGLLYWQAVILPARQEAARLGLEQSIQRAHEARAAAIRTRDESLRTLMLLRLYGL